LKPFIYYIKAVDKWKIGYQYSTNNIVVNVINSLFFLSVYIEVIFIFSIELIIDGELGLVKLGY
jgi:hypothetical protein